MGDSVCVWQTTQHNRKCCRTSAIVQYISPTFYASTSVYLSDIYLCTCCFHLRFRDIQFWPFVLLITNKAIIDYLSTWRLNWGYANVFLEKPPQQHLSPHNQSDVRLTYIYDISFTLYYYLLQSSSHICYAFRTTQIHSTSYMYNWIVVDYRSMRKNNKHATVFRFFHS